MLYFANWKIALICAVCALGVLLSLPNLFSPAFLETLPRWLPHKQVSLGLDLRGGSYLLLEVDVAAAQHERLNSIVDNVRNGLRDANIGYTGLEAEGDAITFTIREPGRIEDARQALRKIDPDLTVDIAGDGAGAIRFSTLATEARRRQAVDQSIEIIRRRIDETGTKEPTIQREGQDRILVQLPGVDNPEHVKALLGRTAKLTFQLVDTGVSLEDARRGRLPPGDEILPAEEGRAVRVGPPSYVVRKRIMVGGDTLVDAQPTFQNNEPVVSFRFDAAGAKRFGDATRENVGKPFAIVLDNKVISAPVIREPILGGSGIISGSFTVQSASDLALLLRAGALPAPITILEERTVGPDLGADFDPCRGDGQHRRRDPGYRLHDFVLRAVRRLRRHRADLQSLPDARQPILARRYVDLARHRRHRADDGHGGRRQCLDLRAHPRGSARRPHNALLARRRVQARLRHDPRQPHHDTRCRCLDVLARLRPGQRLCRDPKHRRSDLAVLGNPGDPAADRHLAAPMEAEGDPDLSGRDLAMMGPLWVDPRK